MGNRVDMQLQGVNDVITGLQAAITANNRNIADLQGAVNGGHQGQGGLTRQVGGILESKAWSGFKTLGPYKMDFREWVIKLKNYPTIRKPLK